VNYSDELNEKQKEAAFHTEGPLLIVAGAGAGKTKTITHRIANLVSHGVPPSEILAITFTNKAAHEMRERALALLKISAPRTEGVPFISTFHSLGVFILKAHAQLFGFTRRFTIADEGDAMSLIKESIAKTGLDPKEFDPRRARNLISRFKGDGLTPEEATRDAKSHLEKNIAAVWRHYEDALRKEQSFDFDDLLLKSVELLKKHPEIRKSYQEKWKYVHIDEYQDTNALQYELSKLLVGPAHNICVVGDSDQNIYSWRGANLKNILNFEKDYPGAKVVLLEENYRSTKTILEAANIVIGKNTVRKEKNLFTKNAQGESIEVVECYDEVSEADYVAKKSDELLSQGVDPSEIAVLYRANFQSRALEEAFLKAEVPYHVLGTKFFERREIKDILSYIKAAQNKESLSDIKRIINVPARGVGKVTLAKLFAGKTAELPASIQKKISLFYEKLDSIAEFAESHLPSETVKFVITESGIEAALKRGSADDLERLENIKELATVALSYDMYGVEEGLEKMLENAALASDQDTLLEKKEGVRLMTVHAAKGLEFDAVFVTGLEQELFPHTKNFAVSKEDQEEERRLFYVALTRARKKLYLTFAGIRTIFGSRQINSPSEFLYDIPEHLRMNHTHYAPESRKTIYFD